MHRFRELGYSALYYSHPGTHQMEPASPLQSVGVNPFPSRFINRTIPWGGFARWWRKEPMKIEKWQQEASALQKKMVLFINLLGKGLTQQINRDGGSIWWAPVSPDGTVRFSLVLTFRWCPRARKQDKECLFVIHRITLLFSLSLSPLIFQILHIHFISVHQ